MNGFDVRGLLPRSVALVLRPLPEEELPLEPEERPAVARALSKRRRDFSAGRACAREALAELGYPPQALPRLDDGRTAWPAGLLGSITHSTRWCAAAVAATDEEGEIAGVGVDIEELGRLSDRTAARVLSAAELDAAQRSPLGVDACRTVMFSAKESIYKCLYPIVERYIDFDEATIEVHESGQLDATLAPALEAALPATRRLRGRFARTSESVMTAVLLRA